MALASKVPVIDLAESFSNSNKEAVAKLIGETLQEVGFFTVTNHGIDPAAIERTFDAARRFFAKDEQDKRKLATFEPLRDAGQPGNLNESFVLGDAVEATWPEDDPEFRRDVESYYERVMRLALHVVHLIAISLDLHEDFFDRFLVNPTTSGLTLRHYPPRSASAPEGQVSFGAHTDLGCVTILAQDDVGGLDVRTLSGEWVPVTPTRGDLIVNIGDIMARWTNDRYQSNYHRVLEPSSGRDRYVAALFCDPAMNTVVECIPALVTDKPKYEPFTVQEFFDERFKAYRDAAGNPVN